MPLQMPSKAFEPSEPLPNGTYEFKFETFKPTLTNAKDKVMLKPVIRIQHTDPEIQGRSINHNLTWSEKTGAFIEAFVHSLGMPMTVTEVNGEEFKGIPGDFADWPGDISDKAVQDQILLGNDPFKNAKYSGPLAGRAGKLELEKKPVQTKNAAGNWVDDPAKGYKNEVKKFLCAVVGCQEKHPSGA